MEIKIIRPFGPSILKVEIPKNIIDELNKYIDLIVLDNEKKTNLNYGEKLAGDVTQEFKLEKEMITKIGWLDFLGKCVYEWIKKDLGKNITKFNLIDSWVVRQFKNEYNPTHWHGGHISGAGFLKVPKSLGESTQQKKSKKYRGGSLQLIHGARMFTCPSTLNITPEVGDFYLFPNYLMHTVFPFKDTEEERRSISFNAAIDEEIYNVYGK